MPVDAMPCRRLAGSVSAPGGNASAAEDGSQLTDGKGRAQEPDRRGEHAVRFGADLRPAFMPATLGEPENDIDSSRNLFESSFIRVTR